MFKDWITNDFCYGRFDPVAGQSRVLQADQALEFPLTIPPANENTYGTSSGGPQSQPQPGAAMKCLRVLGTMHLALTGQGFSQPPTNIAFWMVMTMRLRLVEGPPALQSVPIPTYFGAGYDLEESRVADELFMWERRVVFGQYPEPFWDDAHSRVAFPFKDVLVDARSNRTVMQDQQLVMTCQFSTLAIHPSIPDTPAVACHVVPRLRTLVLAGV